MDSRNMLLREYSTTGVSLHPGLTACRGTANEIPGLCPLDNSIQFGPPAYTLGALDQLPVELLYMILAAADLLSLTTFRRVSKSARLLVDSIPEYSTIIEWVPILIRASLSIGSARWFSMRRLYETLCTAECENCGEFGGFIYIVTCRRACYSCITWSTDYLMLLRRDAVRKFGLTYKELRAVPSITCIPGNWSHYRWDDSPKRAILVDHLSARNAGIALHGSVEAMERYATKAISEKQMRYKERVQNWTPANPKPRMPKCKDEHELNVRNIKRFMGVVRAPFLNTRDRSLAWGLQCSACRNRFQLYTKKTFLEHLKELGEIVQTRAGNWLHLSIHERYRSHHFRHDEKKAGEGINSEGMRERTGDIWTIS